MKKSVYHVFMNYIISEDNIDLHENLEHVDSSGRPTSGYVIRDIGAQQIACCILPKITVEQPHTSRASRIGNDEVVPKQN